MTSSALRRLAVGLLAPAALVAGLAACGSDDVSKDKFASELEDKANLTEAQATCVTDRIFEEYDQSEVNDIYSADTEDEAPDGALQKLQEITVECASEEAEG